MLDEYFNGMSCLFRCRVLVAAPGQNPMVYRVGTLNTLLGQRDHFQFLRCVRLSQKVSCFGIDAFLQTILAFGRGDVIRKPARTL